MMTDINDALLLTFGAIFEVLGLDNLEGVQTCPDRNSPKAHENCYRDEPFADYCTSSSHGRSGNLER